MMSYGLNLQPNLLLVPVLREQLKLLHPHILPLEKLQKKAIRTCPWRWHWVALGIHSAGLSSAIFALSSSH